MDTTSPSSEHVDRRSRTYAQQLAHDLGAPILAARMIAEQLEREATGECRERATLLLGMLQEIDTCLDDALNPEGSAHQPVCVSTLVSDAIRISGENVSKITSVEIASPGAVIFTAKSTLIRRCLTNLLTNAARYSRPDVPPRIKVIAFVREGWLRVCVEDNGIGVADAVQHRLFEHGAKSPSGSSHGHGFGLGSVRTQVALLGGRAGFERLSVGSRFWIELPRDDS